MFIYSLHFVKERVYKLRVSNGSESWGSLLLSDFVDIDSKSLTHTRLNAVPQTVTSTHQNSYGKLPHAPYGSQGLRLTSYQH